MRPASNPKPDLSQVSLLCVDTRTPELALHAMRRCMSQAHFGEAVLVSTAEARPWLQQTPGITLAEIPPFRHIGDYSRFMLRDIGRLTRKPHVLVVQWDGFISDVGLWRDEFLEFDYLGAPWIHEGAQGVVGNGGFSLRSRRLLDALATLDLHGDEAEDVSICVTHRPRLEAMGIRLAPERVARDFSYKRGTPRPSFGFHGLFNFSTHLPRAELNAWLPPMPAALSTGHEARNLIKSLMRRERTPSTATRSPLRSMNDTSDPRPKTAVILQYAGIGDMVWHIVYFKAIAALSRGGKVTVVAQPSTLPRAFLEGQPYIDQVIVHDHRPRRSDRRRGAHSGLKGMWRMAQTLRAGHYDRLVLFSGRPSRGLVGALSGIPDRLGFGYRWLQRIFLTRAPWIAPYKGPSLAVYPEAAAFAMAHGFAQEPLRPVLDVPPEQQTLMQARLGALPRPLHAFAIGTSEPHKQWGLPKFVALAEALIEQGGGVLLLGGPAEHELAGQIESALRPDLRGGLQTITDAPIYGSAAALQLCDVCVGNDTGMVNVAAAVGTPTFVVIGSRPTLDHDPQHLTNIRAAKLDNISVKTVLEALASRSVTHQAR